MTPSDSVFEALLDWFTDHHARGGYYSADAVQAAGGAAAAAELSGLPPEQCIEAGRTAYFEHINGLSRSNEFA